MANEYSRQWFETFLDTIPEDWTETGVDAIRGFLPLPVHRTVLDICCGPGRHARGLAHAGHEVVGVDRDAEAIGLARRNVPSATFEVLDQRELSTLDSVFDAATILWQSFGYFDPATNERILADIAALLRPEGRLLLDVYHPEFVRSNVGLQTSTRAPNCRSIRNEVENGRLVSTITYVDGSTESMDFELFSPEQLTARAERSGFRLLHACTWWDVDRPPSSDSHRYQLILERADHGV